MTGPRNVNAARRTATKHDAGPPPPTDHITEGGPTIMTHPNPTGQRNAFQRPVWLLPEDGVIDPVAIDLAARGVRSVALTPRERRIAAALILAAGGTPNTIAKRLHMAHTNARALAEQITAHRSAA
jgi:DNA-binding CsgD family transcriptional regulator